MHLDTFVYKELKRRNAVREMQGKGKKQASTFNRSRSMRHASKSRDVSQISIAQEDNGEEVLEGAVDDAEAEFMNSALENEILTGDGLLARFVYVCLYYRIGKVMFLK